MERADVPLVIPTLAWMAAEAGVHFEIYLEAHRDGELFARHGSTVLGGMHHQQFNYLHAAFEVSAILWGETAVFDSSLAKFGTPILAKTASCSELYTALLPILPATNPPVVLLPARSFPTQAGELELAPYFFPEIYCRRALAFPPDQALQASTLSQTAFTVALNEDEKDQAAAHFPQPQEVESVAWEDDFGTVTLRLAQRWKSCAKGLVFGDPPAILSQLADHCRHDRIALFAPKTWCPPREIRVSAYVEDISPITPEVARLAVEMGNRVIVGRQTGDGDIFEWSRQGVCIQIVDPNRPAFPVIQATEHPWKPAVTGLFDDEPSDDELRAYAAQGKVLATLIWHSGEVAHNEAMLNLMDLAAVTGVKMGLGVHAARYESCPQLWEMLSVPRSKGGMRGLIEPVLHSGGMGVLAECHCPPEWLREHCETALARIRKIAGGPNTPRGYYAFMDSDLATLTAVRPEVFSAVESAGLDYFISSASPGRNRLLYRTEGLVALNQSCRVVHGASPFVRVTTAEDLQTASSPGPGWMIATLDAPVISFAPYIWRHGSRFMRIIDALKSPAYINATPHTIARYARVLQEGNYLPAQ